MSAVKIDYENCWGEDGEVIVVDGHVDRSMFARGVLFFTRDEMGRAEANELLAAGFPALVAEVQHAYVIEGEDRWGDAYCWWQTSPEHPTHQPKPVTMWRYDGPLRLPAVNDLNGWPVDVVEEEPPPVEPTDHERLADAGRLVGITRGADTP